VAITCKFLYQINDCVEVLIHRLHGKIPDVESLRVFLLLPFLPIFGEPTKFLAGLIDYCECFVRLDAVATRVMGNYVVYASKSFMYMFAVYTMFMILNIQVALLYHQI